MEANNWVSQEILDKVVNANKFNGIVYGKKSGNYTLFGIYLDGEYVYICRDKNASQTKKEIEAELQIATAPKSEKINETTINNSNTSTKSGKSEWLINGDRIIRNNLSYGEMWEKYGTDFE